MRNMNISDASRRLGVDEYEMAERAAIMEYCGGLGRSEAEIRTVEMYERRVRDGRKQRSSSE